MARNRKGVLTAHRIAIDVNVDATGMAQQIQVDACDALRPVALAAAAFALMRVADREARQCGCDVCRRIHAKLASVLPQASVAASEEAHGDEPGACAGAAGIVGHA